MEVGLIMEGTIGVCGVIVYEARKIILYTRKETGEIFYYYELGDKIKKISGLNLKDAAMCINDEMASHNIMQSRYGDAIGIIFCTKEAVIITSDLTAERRSYKNLKQKSDDCILIDAGLSNYIN